MLHIFERVFAISIIPLHSFTMLVRLGFFLFGGLTQLVVLELGSNTGVSGCSNMLIEQNDFT